MGSSNIDTLQKVPSFRNTKDELQVTLIHLQIKNTQQKLW